MNREEILSMPVGRELDALVAEKVLGIKVDYHHWFSGAARHYDYMNENREVIHNYSSDISAAWEAYETVKEKGYWVGIESPFGGKYRCLILDRKNDVDAEYVSDSAPEAICKASLLAVMEWAEKSNKEVEK